MYTYSDKLAKHKNLPIKGTADPHNISWLIFTLNFSLFHHYITNTNDKVYKYSPKPQKPT